MYRRIIKNPANWQGWASPVNLAGHLTLRRTFLGWTVTVQARPTSRWGPPVKGVRHAPIAVINARENRELGRQEVEGRLLQIRTWPNT